MSLSKEQLAALKKIKKCLALAGSSNEHEAAAAMRQAQALMKKHGLSESSVQLSDIGEKGVKATGSQNLHAWESHLAISIADAFGLKTVFQTGTWNENTWARGRGQILFIGPEARTTVAAYCYDCLCRQMRKSLAENRKKFGRILTGTRARIFTEAWIVAASSKVALLASAFDDGPLIEEYCDSINVKGDKKAKPAECSKGMSGTDRDIASLGHSDGSKAQLNPAMNGREEAARLSAA